MTDGDVLTFRVYGSQLNKVTAGNVAATAANLVVHHVEDEDFVRSLCQMMFDKAVNDQAYAELYGQVCSCLENRSHIELVLCRVHL